MYLFVNVLVQILLLSLMCGQTKSLDSYEYEDSIDHSITFIVSLQLQNSENQYKHQCLGTIIHEQFILSAAHCFHRNKDPNDFTVVVGDDILNEGSTSNRHKVVKIMQNEHFSPLQGCDIALLKLSVPLALDGKNLNKINYNSTEYLKDNLRGYVIGRNLFKIEDHGSGPKLKLISHRTIDNKKCRQRKFIHVTVTELCAVADESSGPCDGDSGGALVNPDLNLQWAILSYSRSVCTPHRIYVFTRLQPFLGWINSTMHEIGKN